MWSWEWGLDKVLELDLNKQKTHVNPCFEFMLRNPSAVAQHLAADVFADGGGAVQLEKHVGLQEVLSSGDLEVGDWGAKTHPLL